MEAQKKSSELQWSIWRIAEEFGIPRTTFREALARGSPANRSGPPTILTAEEESEIVGYSLNMQKLGFGLTKQAVNTLIMKFLQEKPREHPFKGGPGKSWWQRFMADHPELSFRVPQALTAARAAKANPIVIQEHFTELQRIIDEHSLPAERIWNMDECGFCVSSRLQKV